MQTKLAASSRNIATNHAGERSSSCGHAWSTLSKLGHRM
jgi:hypothetical protein